MSFFLNKKYTLNLCLHRLFCKAERITAFTLNRQETNLNRKNYSNNYPNDKVNQINIEIHVRAVSGFLNNSFVDLHN